MNVCGQDIDTSLCTTNIPANKSPGANVAAMLPFGFCQMATLQQHGHQVTRWLGYTGFPHSSVVYI